MKIKLWIKYLVNILLLISVIILWGYTGGLSNRYFERHFSANYGYLVITLLIGISVGLILGMEHLINEIKKEGSWKINLPKLILIGLPSLYISLSHIWLYSNIPFLQNIIAYPLFYLLRYGSGSVVLFQLILGYTIITSPYKYSRQNGKINI